MTHGEKFFNFISNVAGRTELRPIDGPKNDFKSPLEASSSD
jgi:ferritin